MLKTIEGVNESQPPSPFTLASTYDLYQNATSCNQNCKMQTGTLHWLAQTWLNLVEPGRFALLVLDHIWHSSFFFNGVNGDC